jgi:Pectate lyase superfamily protein
MKTRRTQDAPKQSSTAQPSTGQPSTARRALLTGGAVGLAAVAGSALGRTQPALAQATATPDWINVTDAPYNAVGDGVTNDTTPIRNAIAAAATAGGGVVYFPAGKYLIENTVTIEIGGAAPGNGQGPIYLVGDGRDVSTLLYSGTDACIHMYNPTPPSGGGFPGIKTWGGGLLGLTIDGTSSTAPAYGLHIGDGEEYQLDLKVQNFAGSGSIGIYIDNTEWWVGRMHAKAQLLNCATAVIFDVASGVGGGDNFGYSEWDFDIFATGSSGSQNGVVIQNGAAPYNSTLRIKGEWELGASTSGVALTVNGNDSNGNASTLTNCELDIWVEVNGSGSPMPQTISLGTGNKIKSCHGFLVFIGQGSTTWVPANAGSSTYVQGQQQFGFYGDIIGDTSLGAASTQGNTSPLQLAGAPVLYAPGYGVQPGGTLTLYMGNGDFFKETLSANAIISWGGQNPQQGPQRKTIILTQSATVAYTVTWPHQASPTAANPAVLWAGGKAPAMTPDLGATDVYYLETYDGVSWYGLANQNVSIPM